MLSRQAVRSAARQSWQQQRRGLAAPASGSFQYQTGDAQGVKFASRDLPGPVGSLAIVAKAGTRFEHVPGLAEGLNRYAFKVRSTTSCGGTWKRKANTQWHAEHRPKDLSPDTTRG